jgi:hypothetical protein
MPRACCSSIDAPSFRGARSSAQRGFSASSGFQILITARSPYFTSSCVLASSRLSASSLSRIPGLQFYGQMIAR